MIKAGAEYIHFKGGRYLVLALAKHSETLEDMVVYTALDGDGSVWARPASMWEEDVGGRPRFAEAKHDN
ncbi:MAG: DUF1653 domain-containing protein [Rickettsiales bacterium]|jgi:hypothetical protein|nr:DUF1653 domain-containing protein [Rickettsiales bacterium]